VFRGFGTVVNVATVLVGSGIGVLLGNRLPQRTRDVVTDGLGLVTLLIGALSAAAVRDSRLASAVGTSAPVLIVLGSLLIGGVAGSLLSVEKTASRRALRSFWYPGCVLCRTASAGLMRRWLCTSFAVLGEPEAVKWCWRRVRTSRAMVSLPVPGRPLTWIIGKGFGGGMVGFAGRVLNASFWVRGPRCWVL